MERFEGESAPAFRDGELVRFHISPKCSGTGRVRGWVSKVLVDHWVIEIVKSSIDPMEYPFSSIVVPGNMIQGTLSEAKR